MFTFRSGINEEARSQRGVAAEPGRNPGFPGGARALDYLRPRGHRGGLGSRSHRPWRAFPVRPLAALCPPRIPDLLKAIGRRLLIGPEAVEIERAVIAMQVPQEAEEI